MIVEPTEESVVAQHGIWLGVFGWPPSTEEGAIIDAFVCPSNHLTHDYHVPGKKEIIVYSLPWPMTLERAHEPLPWQYGYVEPKRRKAS